MIFRCWRYRFKSEVASIRYVRSLVPENTTMLDIGANRGIYSIYMSRAAGKKGKVIAFEAQPELGEYLYAVKESFSLNNLEIVSTALSSESRTMTLRRKSVGSGSASLDFYGDDKNLDSLDVPVITLDNFLESRNDKSISFIKCDVEGHEANVFYGAEMTLKKYMPTLLFECHRSEEEKGDLFSFLSELGYTGFFYHVEPKDHANIFRRGKGQYIHYAKYADYEYCRPGVEHRNYFFVKKGSRP
ncbi:MAG: FkbM family methyltransferase [Pseudomonadota bacterium]|nr:FkbM family methyltransferase [Pseudomonadota bacterium]